MKNTVIFDFDGTVANTLESVVRIVNDHADHFGYRTISAEDIPYLQGKKPTEILSHLGISFFKLPLWIRKIHSEINKEIINMKLTADIFPLLSDLHLDEKRNLGIITSNTEENVMQFLSKNKIDFFDFIHTGKNVFGKSHVINKILKQHSFDKNDTCYVCDEVRDIEAARKSGISSIAVTWGYNSKDALLKENPDFIVDTPEELRSVLFS